MNLKHSRKFFLGSGQPISPLSIPKGLVKNGCWWSREGGFSLVELLIVIAVIAIIATIAIPNIANITGAADAAKSRRNAQNIAVAYNSAIAAGMATNAATDLPGAIDVIVAGTNIGVGNTIHYYAVDGLSPEESLKAQDHLSFSNGLVVLLPSSD